MVNDHASDADEQAAPEGALGPNPMLHGNQATDANAEVLPALAQNPAVSVTVPTAASAQSATLLNPAIPVAYAPIRQPPPGSPGTCR